jgi:hypothetical protein
VIQPASDSKPQRATMLQAYLLYDSLAGVIPLLQLP